MNRCTRIAQRTLLSLAIAALSTSLAAAPWTYRGTLDDGGQPANGRYDLRLTLLDENAARAVTTPVTLYGVEVKDGVFAVDVEFGIDLSKAPVLKLKTEVQQGASGFTALGEATRFDAQATLAGICWDTTGNSGTTPATNFLGTIDAQPLVLRTRNVQSLRIEPSTVLFGGNPTTVNLIAGSAANNVTAGVRGATISGGGAPMGNSDPDYDSEEPNRVTDHYGTVGGGYNNQAGGLASGITAQPFATVAGGTRNLARGSGATVGGGRINDASGDHSTVSGGDDNSASGTRSSVAGGAFNNAAGIGSSASGVSNCAGGDYSWAGGLSAKVRVGNEFEDGSCASNSADPDGDNGTFVWSDSQGPTFVSTGPDQFLVRANGGMGINTARFGMAVDLRGAELVIKNSTLDPNVDIEMVAASTNRGYGIAVEPGAAGAAGNFYISEVDARTAAVGFTPRLQITAAGNTLVQGGSVGILSDRRLKKNFADIQSPLTTMLSLRGQVFEYIDPARSMNAPGPHMGFVAQDVQKVIPDWVAPVSANGYLAVSPVGFEALTVEAMRELRSETSVIDESLSARIDTLEHENATLRARLEALEKRTR